MPDRGNYPMRYAALSIALLSAMTPASAQDAPAGRVADSAVGQAGQRQTRDQASTNVVSTGRINGRIQNRVQSRVRSRIERNYGSQANAASPFEIAGEQARTASRPNRR